MNHVGRVPVRTDQALRVHVLAKLLVSLLIESLIDQGEPFPLGELVHMRLKPGAIVYSLLRRHHCRRRRLKNIAPGFTAGGQRAIHDEPE